MLNLDVLDVTNPKFLMTIISFEVTSLCTNIPVEETIYIAANNVSNTEVPPFSTDIKKFKKLFKFATMDIFTYKNNKYK